VGNLRGSGAIFEVSGHRKYTAAEIMPKMDKHEISRLQALVFLIWMLFKNMSGTDLSHHLWTHTNLVIPGFSTTAMIRSYGNILTEGFFTRKPACFQNIWTSYYTLRKHANILHVSWNTTWHILAWAENYKMATAINFEVIFEKHQVQKVYTGRNRTQRYKTTI